MNEQHHDPSVKVEEIEPASFSLQIAGWVWGVSLALVIATALSEGVRIFASFLLIPILVIGVPVFASVGMLYGLRGMRTARKERAAQGLFLNAAACAAVAIAVSVFL
jgi:hypothetical protein